MEIGKNIVLCSDGTGNTMMKGRGTNVWKLYEAVDLTAHRWHQGNGDANGRGKEQIAFYDDGVGSQDNKIMKIIGGAFGWGLKRNILDLYKSLCRAYRAGDDIYIFGFSRGAYTARVLAGLILSCGILRHDTWTTDEQLDRLSRKAYDSFRKHFKLGTAKGRKADKAWREVADATRELEDADEVSKSKLSRKLGELEQSAEHAEREAKAARARADAETDAFRRKYAIEHDVHAPDGNVTIRFLGVWDTVAAVGLPFREFTKLWNRFVYPFMFPDYLLSPRVQKGCHAISIDDERRTFHPMMWDERQYSDPQQTHLEQVWFAGVHSNVGGGYPKQGISLVALDWMMQRAQEMGLKFIESERDRYRHLQNIHDKLYNSRHGLAVYYRYRPRNIGKICRRLGIEPAIHVSALERIALGTQDYAPGNLPGEFRIVTTDPDSGAAPEDPEKLERVVADIGGETAFKDVGHWIRLRRAVYAVFVAVTAAMIGFAAWYHTRAEKTDPWVPDALDKGLDWLAGLLPFGDQLYEYLIRPFFIYPAIAATALGLMLIFWLSSRMARLRLRRTFAHFWRSKLPEPWW